MARDPELWGDLQHHVSLPECVYLMLSLREFFQLRGVCKDWNRLARDRRCLTDPLRKPYSTKVHKNDVSHNENYSLYGMLTFDIATTSVARWRWTDPHLAESTKPFHILCKAFSVKNLTFDLNQSPFIYDEHTERSGQIPQPPEHAPCDALGIVVDNSVMPYTFQIIIGSVGTKTQVYDSCAWTTRGSNGSESPGSEFEQSAATSSSEDEGEDDQDEDGKAEGNSSESDGNGSDQDDDDGDDGGGSDDEDGPPSSGGESEDEGLDEPDDQSGSDSDGSS